MNDQEQRRNAATAYFVAELHRRLNACMERPDESALQILLTGCREYADRLQHGQCARPTLPRWHHF